MTSLRKWKGVDRKDFGDMIYSLGQEYKDSDEKNKYVKGSGETSLTFDIKEVEKWTVLKNKEILKLARERANGYIDWDKMYPDRGQCP